MTGSTFGRFRLRLVRRLISGALHYPTEHRRLRLFWLDGVTANVAEALIITYSGLYLLSFGASNAQVGIQAALANLLAAAALFPGARFVERWGQRKRLVVLSGGGAARLALLGLVVVPFIFRPPAVFYAVITCIALRAFFNNLANPAWTSLAADLVPLRLRGRYFASRQFGMAIASLLSTVLAGQAITRMGAPAGYQASFFVAFLFGLAATYFFASIPEPAPRPVQVRTDVADTFASYPAARRNFLLYVATQFIWSLSLQIAGPFFNVYIVEGLKGTTAEVGWLSGISTLASLAGLRYFGRQTDRRGARWTVRTAGLLIPFLPWAWTLVQAPWQVAFINAPAGFVWAGYELGNFALLLAITPESQRARLVATYQTVIFFTAFVGPLIGGLLVQNFGFKLVFFVSGLGRLIGILLFTWLVREPTQESGDRGFSPGSVGDRPEQG
jgi:MFS family permease